MGSTPDKEIKVLQQAAQRSQEQNKPKNPSNYSADEEQQKQPSFPLQKQKWLLSLSYDAKRRGNGTPLQCSCLENPMDGGVWLAAGHGVTKSRTLLSNFTFTFHFHALEKEMATHSSVLAWRIPGTGEPGGLPSMWSHRVGHD